MTDEIRTSQNEPLSAQEQQRRRRAITVSLITTVLFLVITAAFTPRLLMAEHPNYWGYALTLPVALIGLVAAWLAYRYRISAAGYLLIGTILVLSLGAPFVGHGQGVSVGILVAILGTGIAANTLPREQAGRAVWVSVVTGVLVIIIDQLAPDPGLESNALYTNAAVAVLAVAFLIVAAQRFETFALRTKLILAFSVVMMLPLLILGIYNNFVATQNLTQQSRAQLDQLSHLVAEHFDGFFAERLSEIQNEAQQLPLVDYMNLSPEVRPGSIEESKAAQTLLTFQKKNPQFIDSYAILDANGLNWLDTVAAQRGQDEHDQTYFKQSLSFGLAYVSNVMFNTAPGGSIVFSAPIKDSSGKTLGVLRAVYRASMLQSLAHSFAPHAAHSNIALVDRETTLRLADVAMASDVFMPYKSFTELEWAALRAQGRVPSGDPKLLLSNTDPVTASGIENLATQPFFQGTSAAFDGTTISTGHALQTLPWTALAQQSLSSTLEAARAQNRNTIFISLALAGLAILIAYFASQVLAAPLVTLTQVAEKISAGDISARAQVTTEDEIGALSTSFNRMTDELNQTLNTLEERVAERTVDLEISRQQSERRANVLTAIGEISRVISTEQHIDALLPLIVRLVNERFNFYHTGIFLLDETRQFAVLQAASSDGGKRLLSAGHQFQTGSDSIVGAAAATGKPRLALDLGEGAVTFDNPFLPATRSEIALPLISRSNALGVLDVHSDKPAAFSEDDISTLGILADQIAIAIENARLFQQTQQTLNEFESLYRQNVQRGWSSFSKDEPLLGYEQTIAGGRGLSAAIETDEIREVLNRGNLIVTQPISEGDDSFIVVPLKLRGQVIGTIKVQAPTRNRRWSKDEVGLAAAVADRLSLALENARLIQESRRQVIKEQTITEVTSKIGASIDLRNVLQTAVEELGRAMPGSEVLIRFEENDGK